MKRFLALIVGIVFVGVGVFMYYKNDYLVKNCTVEAEAIVVDMEEEIDSSEENISYLYYPIIEYMVNDNVVKVKMSSGSSVPAYRINDKLTILYNPNKKEEFIVKGDKTSNFISIVFIGLGVIVTGLGIKIAISKNENEITQ